MTGITNRILLRRSVISIAVTAAVVCIALPAESSGPATRRGSGGASSKPAASAPAGPLKNLKIDRKGKRVIIDAKVTPRKMLAEKEQKFMLEFLMCKTGVKEHETLLTTDVAPSSLHAALLVLGLAPGRPAQWVTPVGKKPVFISPAGAALNISVRWTDKKGVVQEVPVTDWIVEVASKKKMPKTRWVFVGSDFLDDGRYWADLEGLHISVSNFAAGVIDVPFKSSSENALREFAANMSVIPPRGTPVKLIIQAVKGAQTAPAARIMFDVGADGRIKLDGKVIVPEKISQAVRRFLSRHADASADVRIDPRALVFDRERLRKILEQSGLTRITFSTRELRAEILPRTPADAKRAIKWWKRQFAQAEDLIVDPAEDAAESLEHIKRRIKQAEAMSELWRDYAAGLQKAMDEYKAQQKKKKESDGRIR